MPIEFDKILGKIRDRDESIIPNVHRVDLTWGSPILIATNAGLLNIKQLQNQKLLALGNISNKLYKSLDNGLTWDAGISITPNHIGAIALTQLRNKDILVSGYAGTIYRTKDEGLTWDLGVTVDATTNLTAIFELQNGDLLATGYTSCKVYRSTDGGLTWDAGTHVVYDDLMDVIQLANGWVLIAGLTSDAIYKSVDNGHTWDSGTIVEAGAGLYGLTELKQSDYDPMTCGLYNDNVYISEDFAITWEEGTLVETGAGIVRVLQLQNGDVVAIGYNTNKMYKAQYTDTYPKFPENGQLVFDTDLKILLMYQNTEWIDVSALPKHKHYDVTLSGQTDFILPTIPVAIDSICLNGQEMAVGINNDYTISSDTISFTSNDTL